MNDVGMSQKQLAFLRDLLQKAIKYIVEVEIKADAKGTYFVQFPTIKEGYPIIESFLTNAPFYVASLIEEVDRLRAALRDIQLKSTDKGPAEKILFDIEQAVKALDLDREPSIKGDAEA